MQVQVPLTGSQQYTWFPADDSWLVTSPDVNALAEVTDHEQAAFAVYLSQAVPLTTPLGLDAPPISTSFGDVRRLGDQALPDYPHTSGIKVDIPLPEICAILLKHRALFERNDTIYLIVDSRAPSNVSHWPAFCAWWSSRRNLVGPYRETTDLCYIIADSNSGLSNIPFYWIGPFVLWMARYLYPRPTICLIDNDCVPTALFEMRELDCLLLPLPTPYTLVQGGVPNAPGMILVTEQHFELNAGMVIVAPSDHTSPLTPELWHQYDSTLMGPTGGTMSLSQQLTDLLLRSRIQLLGSTCPPANPTQAASSGLLLTPLLGVRMRNSLDLCAAWTVLGELCIKAAWPLPTSLALTGKWPRVGSGRYLTQQGASRKPALTSWARGCFEQGALSALLDLEGPVKIRVLPGHNLFQSCHIPDNPMLSRPPVFHAYGSAKHSAHQKLQQLATEGWVTLLPTLLGTVDQAAPWTQEVWLPMAGLSMHPQKPSCSLSPEMNLLFSLRWTVRPQPGRPPAWMVALPFDAPSLLGVSPLDTPQADAPPCDTPFVVRPVPAHPSETQPMDTDLSVDSPTEASSCSMMETDDNDIASSLRQLTDGTDLDDNLPQIQALLRNAELHCLLALIPEMDDQLTPLTPAHIHALLFLDNDIKAPIITARLGKLLSEDPPDCPTFIVDAPGLNSAELGLLPAADLVIASPRSNESQLYGASLCPANIGAKDDICAYANTPAGHEFAAFLYHLHDPGQLWEVLALGTSLNIYRQANFVLRAAQRLPAHRRMPHDIFLISASLRLLALHPSSLQVYAGMLYPTQLALRQVKIAPQLVIRGFSAGSYTGAVLSLLANALPVPWCIQVTLGAIAMPPAILASLHAIQADQAHRVRLVHLEKDQLCRWHPPNVALACQLLPTTYFTHAPGWMRAPYHTYEHLVPLTLPLGSQDFLAVWREQPELLPYHFRIAVPLRLVTWMRMTGITEKLSPDALAEIMRHPDPIPPLLQTLQCQDTAEACQSLLKELVLKPASSDRQFPKATAELVQRLVSEYLAQVPLLELCSILVWFLPQVPREQPQDRIMTRPELHSFPTPSRLVYKFEGLGGMDHFYLHLDRPADLPFVFAPSLPQKTMQDCRADLKLLHMGQSRGDVLVMTLRTSQDPTQHHTIGAIVMETTKPKLSKYAAEQDELLRKGALMQLELAMLPHPHELLQLPRWWELPTGIKPQWSSCYALRGLERYEIVYSSLRGRSWDCSHLLQLSRTPRPHRPLALGIPVRSPMVPVEIRGKAPLLHSLSLLFQLLASQDADSSVAPALSRTILDSVRNDGGHLIAVAASLALALHTGRTDMCIQGVFGAGKTRCLTLLLLWVGVTTQESVTLVSKENPAGRAVAALISHYLPLLPDYAKHKFSRVCSQQETGQHQPYKIDSTLNMLSTGKLAQISIFTTGLLWANQQAYSPKLIEHLKASSLVIIEEAQQAADIKTAFATSLLPAESLLVYQGDDRQSPGGSEDMNEVRALRKVLLNTPIGLRAHNEYYQPWKLPRLFSQLIASSKEVTTADLRLHCYEIADPTQTFNPYRQGGCARSVNSITHWIEPHLPQPADARELLNLHHPLGFLVGIMLTLASPNHGLFLHNVQTNMEAAGLDGLHKWGITLPSSARVSHEIYEPAIAILYPHLCERYLGGWSIGQPVLSPVEGPPSGPRFIQLSQSVEWKFSRGNEVADDVSVQTYRDIYAIALDQISQLDIGAKEMEGLLVMCNRTEVHGVLSTYPDHLLPESKDDGQPIAVKVDTVVRVAGATCRHGLLFQTYKGFLSGSFVSASEADAEETALRANVGFTRATRSMTMLSPKDMTGLPGAFQVLATYLHGVQTITKDSQDNVIIRGKVSKAVYTPPEVRDKLSQRELYVNMPPLSLLELSYKQEQPSEIVAQHSRVTKRGPPEAPADFDPSSGRATRLRLILAHRKDVQHWTDYSLKTYQHAAWPGGDFQHELLWGYAVDGSAVPRYVVLPTASGWELTRPTGNMQRGNFLAEYDSLSLIHFYDAWRLHPMLITLEDYISELRPTSHLLPKLQRMLDRWQALPPHERPSNQHPIKRPPLPPLSRRNDTPSSFAAQDPTPVGPTGGTTGEPIPEEATGIITEDQIPEVRRARWIVAMEELLQHLPQWLQQDNNYNRRDALSIMSDLPSSWPSCRLCINADAVATSYLAGMHRLFLEAKLNEKDQQTALQEANARAYEMEAMCLDPLASHLHQLFATDDDLFFDVYPDEWKQLQKLEFWQLSLMQEVSRIRRFIDKSTGKANFPQHTIEGVVHLQPRIHAPIDSLPTLLVIVTFPVTYLKIVLPRLPPLQSTVIAPQTKHLEDVQRVRMASEAIPFAVPLPDSPRVQAAFCAGLLHPEGADRVIPMPSIKYSLEVVLPTLDEISQSQASLKEGALLQPAKHPLLPDSQYLWQVTLVQQKEFGSYEAHQNSRAIIPLTEAKAKPLHSALRTDHACSRLSPEELRRIFVEGRPVKATNKGQPWKEAEQLNPADFFRRIHRLFDEIGASTRMRQEYTDYHAGKQAKKQEKLAHKRPRKQPDHVDQWTEQHWSQRTWNAGWEEGWHEPASSSSSGWHYQR